MVSHGLIAGLLFGVVGRMLYDRTHTRDLTQLQAMSLARHLPFAAVVFALASFASMGLPGFSGFVAELQVLIGVWEPYPVFAITAGFGVLVAVAYSLRALQQTFFSPGAKHGEGSETGGGPITVPEHLGAALLLGGSLFLGLWPEWLLRLVRGALAGPLFEWLGKGGVP
jgi:NADH-quinone oxidoreductase subunit M